MQIDLSGKTAIVTGSTRGIGFAIAKGLAQAGATVVINGRSAPSVDKAVSLLQQYVPDATLRGVVADVGSVDGCAVLKAAEPEVDILVNNTGIYGPRDFFETGDDIWTEFFEVNMMSGVRLSREYLPGMVSRQWGRVIFISSESALNIPADMIHYGFTKTANLSVARGLAKRMAGTGVTVNSILPGPTLSEGVAEMLKEASERTGQTLEEVAADFVRENRPSSILQRAATTEEVANLVVYTASPLASATTGAALRVDGGVVDTIA
ncbi:SDR family NAD(P)-dependent oxidoreductase [Pseudomonas luteola]|uniref:SDR family NAD(P)-dependent oxidoreductase n=1 Tax=Pseudomonas luteola TaxID=47886 RepID=UPI00123C15F4|nr:MULTISPECIES: SDR family oxidoreductase [Pseudomonas]MBA1247375.1 SDR family oxidoreductase [Pseudomonas zeshuii]QEU28016.1 SDR family oxidoreductase [Pseudomonas luteola]